MLGIVRRRLRSTLRTSSRVISTARQARQDEGDLMILDRVINSSSPTTTDVQENMTAMNIPPPEDPLLRYVASSIMRHGLRHAAERRTSKTLAHIHTLTRSSPLPVLRAAVERVAPSVRVSTWKRGGKSIHMPAGLSEKQRVHKAMSWILEASKKRGGISIEERLAKEIVEAARGQSEVLKKKDEVHKFAAANRGNLQGKV